MKKHLKRRQIEINQKEKKLTFSQNLRNQTLGI